MDTQKKLSKVTLLAYGCGDFASNLCSYLNHWIAINAWN